MSIITNVLGIVREEMTKSGSTVLRKVTMRVGELTAVEPDSLRFCFAAATEGTELAGAVLQIEEVPLCALCAGCEKEFPIDGFQSLVCPDCGIAAGEYSSGKELDIVSMEVG